MEELFSFSQTAEEHGKKFYMDWQCQKYLLQNMNKSAQNPHFDLVNFVHSHFTIDPGLILLYAKKSILSSRASLPSPQEILEKSIKNSPGPNYEATSPGPSPIAQCW